MKTARFWVVTASLAAVVVAGLAWLAPATHGQVVVARGDDDARDVVRRVEVLAGRGSAIGVAVRDVDEADVGTLKLTSRHGAVIEEVEKDSAADKAGFKASDVVVSFDGEAVRSARQFSRVVEETPAGRPVKATVMRQGARVDLDVTPATGQGTRLSFRGMPGPEWRERSFQVMPRMPAMPAVPDMREFHFDLESAMGQGVLGVGVQDLTDDLAGYFGVKDGVLVNSVRPDSPAAKAGLKAGDVITSVDGRDVDNPSELRRLLRESESAVVKLGVTRDRKAMSLEATLDKPESRSKRPRWSA
jgi:serine protease Do